MVITWQVVTIMWPVMLGGVPRRSLFHSGSPSKRNLEVVRALAKSGELRGVVDSVWGFDDAVKVCSVYSELLESLIWS